MLEVFAQLGEIYLVRGANDGVREFIRRIRDCLAIYSGIVAGTMPEAAAQLRMSDAEVAQMIRRYSRRAQFLEAGLAAAQGDHEDAETGADGLGRRRLRRGFPALADEHAYLLTYARILCATALCDDDLHVQSVPLWEAGARRYGPRRRPCQGGNRVRRLSPGGRGHRVRPILRRNRAVAGGRTLAAARGGSGAGERVGISQRQNAIGASGGILVGGRQGDDRAAGVGGLSRHRAIRASSRRIALLAVPRPHPVGTRRTGGRRPVLGTCRAALA